MSGSIIHQPSKHRDGRGGCNLNMIKAFAKRGKTSDEKKKKTVLKYRSRKHQLTDRRLASLPEF